MGKRRKKVKSVNDVTLKENEVVLHGSANGWLKMRDSGGEETILIPECQTEADEPANFVLIGKFTVKFEEEVADDKKAE